MKRKAGWLGLLLVGSLMSFGACQKAADNSGKAAASPTAETVDTAGIEAELMKIENDWPRIIKEKDVATVKRIEAEDAVFVYPDGSIGDKAKDVSDMESGALSADSWEVLDVKVTVLNKDAAFVSGRSVVKNGKYKTPDGKSVNISGQYRFIDTYARRNGQWQEVAGVSTPIVAPEATASPVASPAAKPSPSMAASPAMMASPAMKPPADKSPAGAKPMVKTP